MANLTLRLTIVSQEKKLLETEVDSLTVPGSQGELTILPKHIALFTPLQVGELTYKQGQTITSFVISKGFLDVSPDGNITVIVDTAKAARDISLSKAEAAVKQAHETMQQTADQRELFLAEASLKQALLEIKIAQKTKKAGI